MKKALAVAFLFVSTSVRADVILTLTDAEKSALISVLAAGIQAQPQLAPQTVFLINKILTAPKTLVPNATKETPP